MADRNQMVKMFEDAVREFRHIDIVVLNVAINNIVPVTEAE